MEKVYGNFKMHFSMMTNTLKQSTKLLRILERINIEIPDKEIQYTNY